VSFLSRTRLQEAAIVLVLFASASIWGATYWNRSFQAGRQPQFYQSYFEPAVMFACGRGFLLSHPTIPAVRDFLEQKVDRLSCDQIPATAGVSDYGLYQKTWLYLMLTVGTAWKLLGVSWSGMGPLFGLLFGATVVAAYGIFRIGMNRVIALAGAAALAVSAVHLQNLPHLRDYAKAPFMLALIWLLFAMVSRAPSWSRLLAVAAAYGAVLGIGYGFRTDFLIEIPVFFFVLFLFTGGGWLRNLPMKFAAAAVCLALFACVAWPVISAVRRGGGCQWHAALLGLTDPFNEVLLIAPGPYSFGHEYSDNLVDSTVDAFAVRQDPAVGHIEYCSPQYDAASGQYLAALARIFPGDAVTRTLASIARITGLPFRWSDQPLPGFARLFFRLRLGLLRLLRGTGPIFVGLALAGLAAADLRLGLFGLFVIGYFGGYPMLQFGVRHYFHLEFLTWWAAGFIAQGLWLRVRDGIFPALRWQRAIAMYAVTALVIGVAWWGARVYQQRSARSLFQSYVDAPRDEVRLGPYGPGTLYPVMATHPADTDPYPAEVVAIDTDARRCRPDASVTFRYREAQPEFTHTVSIASVTRVFEPVYARFEGVEFGNTGPDCVTGVFKMTAPERIPVLLSVRLSPSWGSDALYQTLAGLSLR